MISRLAVLGLVLCYCGTAEAYGSLRCQGRIIDTGITMEQVLALCGQPDAKVVEAVPMRARVFTGFSRFTGISFAEQWEYSRGWGKFPAVLIFQDGVLRRIEYRRYRSR